MASIGDTTRPAFAYDQATDTWVPVGVGPHSHTPAAIGAISSSLVTTKGDLIVATGSGTVVRQGVGADGSMLVADSSQADGVSYALGNAYAAGKNKIINGDFGIWQRGTTFTPPIGGNGTYAADRMWVYWDGTGTTTFSRQSFAAGTAPVTGYESTYYMRSAMSSGANFLAIAQLVEDVRTFAGQTATISFWAKASSSVTVTPLFRQGFGTGGSALVDTYATPVTLTSSWARYTVPATVPSVAGKTIGTSSYLQVYPIVYTSGTIASNTIDIWGMQVEAGVVASPFQTATGNPASELAACQRYFCKSYSVGVAPGGASNDGIIYSGGNAVGTTTGYLGALVEYPVTMRTIPTVTTYDTAYNQGKVARVTPGASDQVNLTPSGNLPSDKRITILVSGGNAHSGLGFHYTASAEL